MVGNLTSRWPDVMDALSLALPEQVFNLWFRKLDVQEFTVEKLRIGVSNMYVREGLLRHSTVFTDAVRRVVGISPELAVVISPKLFQESRAGGEREEVRKETGRRGTGLNPDFRLDRFVVGPRNQLAYSACMEVVRRPGAAYNPLFVHGGPGLGKTHLMQGVCRAIIESHPGRNIVYTSCEEFVNEFVRAIRKREWDSFRARYRSCDVLAIDDVHFLASKEKTEAEFFHTFDVLRNLGRQVVLSSDVHPHEMNSLRRKLTGRFTSGLVAHIDPPCIETRMEIVRFKARLRDIDLPEPVVDMVAEHAKNNVRELEGAIARICVLASVEQRAPDEELAKRALAGVRAEVPHVVTLKALAGSVAKAFGVDERRIRSASRARRFLLPRQVAMYLARRLTDYSLAEIGSFFGGKNHTTVLHAQKRIASLIQKDENISARITRIEEGLR